MAVPQLTIGNYYHTQAKLRYFGYTGQDDVPDIQLLGLGIQHGLTQYFGQLPLDLSVALFYQQFTIGDIIESDAFAIAGMGSKEFGILTIYGGVQYEKTQMDLNYTRSGSSDNENSQVDLSFDAENSIRGYAGFGLDLSVVHIRTDINIGNVSVLSASIGFGI